jgi:hypothetical protein
MSIPVKPGMQCWTVKVGRREYGCFGSYAEAEFFARSIGGGRIHEYRQMCLAETKVLLRNTPRSWIMPIMM